MAKLFSLEEQQLSGGGAEVELDSIPEEGAVADVVQQMGEDHQEITGLDQGVQEGTDAAAQLQVVQQHVQDVVDSGEGLSQQSQESYRLTMETIAMLVGAPKDLLGRIYSQESFGGSNRLVSTQISVEGIGEFLKNLWERIKAAIKTVIEKVKAFYAKHLSGLGRVTKALESMKKKITATKGTVGNVRVKTPGSLRSSFPTSVTLKAEDVAKYIATHVGITSQFRDKEFHNAVKFAGIVEEAVKKYAKDIDDFFKKHTGHTASEVGGALVGAGVQLLPAMKEEIEKELSDKFGDKELAKSTDPLVGGWIAKVELTLPDQVTITRKQVEMDRNQDGEASVASKQDMTKLINDCIKLINDTKTFDKTIKDFEKSFNTISTELSKSFNSIESEAAEYMKANKDQDHSNTKEGLDILRGGLRAVGKVSSMVPTFAAGLSYMNVKLGFAVVSYCKFNLAQYK